MLCYNIKKHVPRSSVFFFISPSVGFTTTDIKDTAMQTLKHCYILVKGKSVIAVKFYGIITGKWIFI